MVSEWFVVFCCVLFALTDEGPFSDVVERLHIDHREVDVLIKFMNYRGTSEVCL